MLSREPITTPGEAQGARPVTPVRRASMPVLLLVLFLAALILRLPGLDSYLTPDERLWSNRTLQFMDALERHDWAATTTTSHPGVSTTWAGATGLLLQWTFARPAGMAHLSDLQAALASNPNRLDTLPWLRLPVALACSLGIVLLFWLARRLFDTRVALLAAAFMICDPFLAAHSKVLHLDALLATSLSIAWLSLLVATRSGQRRYLALSGAAAGFGILTKSPALVLGPLMLSWLLWQGWRARRPAAAIGLDLLWTGLPALAILLLLWPALWVAPLATAAGVFRMMSAYGETGHELGNYWLGRAATEPGLLFYPTVVLWRAMPVILAGLLLALPFTLARSERRGHPGGAGRTAGALWLFALWYAAVLSTGDKKFDRYVLPVFPILDLLAAWGWISTGRWLAVRLPALRRGRRGGGPAWAWGALALVLIAAQLWPALASGPSYLTAYNPLLGGLAAARRVMLVGWGEGLAEAAEYLNAQPGAEEQHAAAWYGANVFGPFYRGGSYDLYYDLPQADDLYAHDVDWVVTYENQLQRNLLDPRIQARLAQPVFTSAQQGVPLAWVYRWPKPFAHTADRRLADGLRLVGWTVGAYDAATGRLHVELDWDAAALEGGPLGGGVSAWVKDAAGEVWASVQAPVTSTLRQVPGWSGRPAAAQDLALQMPTGLAPGPYRVEMAVSGGEGQALGQLKVEATRREAGAAPADVQPVKGDVTFGGAMRLAGYAFQPRADEDVLDLLWVTQQPSTTPRKLFVHVATPDGRIAWQYDGPLTQLAGGLPSASSPAADYLLRQRVHLPPSANLPAGATLYIGIYEEGSGQRLPVVAGGATLPDGRYPLDLAPR